MRFEFKALFILLPLTALVIAIIGLLVNFDYIDEIWIYATTAIAALIFLLIGTIFLYTRGGKRD